MSGSSRHGSLRPSAAAGTRPGTGSGSGTGSRAGGGRGGSGRRAPDGGRPSSGRGGAGGRAQAGGRAEAGPRPAPVDAEQVAGLIEPVVTGLGMDLEGVRVTSAGRRRVLRIIVDADGGVSLDDIAEVSRDLSVALDDSTIMGDLPYTLEVSSPGVDRPLTERRHWRRAIGRLVVAPLLTPESAPDGNGGQRAGTIEGRVTGASADGITLDVAGESRRFGYGDLGPGKIKIEFAPISAGPGDEDPDEGADEEGSDGH
jgi:ribosome maturation factor RimP